MKTYTYKIFFKNPCTYEGEIESELNYSEILKFILTNIDEDEIKEIVLS